jgi:hypothetical protein
MVTALISPSYASIRNSILPRRAALRTIRNNIEPFLTGELNA